MQKVSFVLFVCLAVLFSFSTTLKAQEPDTLDVPQGPETLNLAVEGDTTATGEPKNPNRVYRLERGGYYLLNGAVRGFSDVPLRIVAAEGDGPMPIIIPVVDETGAADRAFRPRGSVEVRGLYITGIDNLGNQAEKNMFRCDGMGARIIIDNCFLDHDGQSFVRMNAEGQSVFMTNTTARNSIDLASTGNGRIIDTRGNTQDTIFVQNCTWYVTAADPLRAAGGIIKNVWFDHVTMYQVAGYGSENDIDVGINVHVTNSLFVDFGYEGHYLADSTGEAIVPIDTLGSDLAAEEDRVYEIRNNVLGFTPELLAWLDTKDSLETYSWHDDRGERFIAQYPKMVSENNIIEYPVFSDPPDPNVIVAYAEHRFNTGYSDEGNPDPRADRNGMAALTDDPLSAGPAPDEYDFDYSTTSQAYTHAEGGFPVGDLRWFPDKLAEWKDWIATGVEKRSSQPTDFALHQNYPNPFNPSTTISYQLNMASDVELAVFNSLGQKVKTLVKAKQAAGQHVVQWDALDEAGNKLGSGLYFYKLQSGDQVQVRKMLLVK